MQELLERFVFFGRKCEMLAAYRTWLHSVDDFLGDSLDTQDVFKFIFTQTNIFRKFRECKLTGYKLQSFRQHTWVRRGKFPRFAGAPSFVSEEKNAIPMGAVRQFAQFSGPIHGCLNRNEPFFFCIQKASVMPDCRGIFPECGSRHEKRPGKGIGDTLCFTHTSRYVPVEEEVRQFMTIVKLESARL